MRIQGRLPSILLAPLCVTLSVYSVSPCLLPLSVACCLAALSLPLARLFSLTSAVANALCLA